MKQPRHNKSWTDPETRTAIRMIEENCSMAEICERLGRTRHSITSRLRNVGYCRPTRTAEWRSRRIEVLADESLSHSEAAEVLGITSKRVSEARREMGIRRLEHGTGFPRRER